MTLDPTDWTPDQVTPELLETESLGPCRVPSPFEGRRERFVSDDERILYPSRVSELTEHLKAADGRIPSFEAAGARRRIFFEPREIACGIVSCGGLCPGINNVIRALVLTLSYGYGVRRIHGFRFGYAGVAGDAEVGPPLDLTPDLVEPIHRLGGSFLGSSRGPQDATRMVDELCRLGVRILFTIGGDGTLRGASALAAEVRRRGLELAVVGIPKTIDNDIRLVERSFGFATAVEEARRVIVGAHAEARGALGGVGLVKLMGRHSGFITAHATLANNDVNFCLVPEVPFALEGEGGFLQALEQRLAARRHAVVVVAEGVGQELMGPDSGERDASGNRRLRDIGPFLKERIKSHLKARGMSHTVKYIDPSYIVRSLPAGSVDAEYCLMLGQHAVHAGMAGRTDVMVGSWNGQFTHVPLAAATAGRKQIRPDGPLWTRVLEATGQPCWPSTSQDHRASGAARGGPEGAP